MCILSFSEIQALHLHYTPPQASRDCITCSLFSLPNVYNKRLYNNALLLAVKMQMLSPAGLNLHDKASPLWMFRFKHITAPEALGRDWRADEKLFVDFPGYSSSLWARVGITDFSWEPELLKMSALQKHFMHLPLEFWFSRLESQFLVIWLLFKIVDTNI